MNPFDLELRSLVKCFSAQKIKYALIGGIAVSVYGEPRFTADIDVNVILDKTGIKTFLTQAKKYGFSPLLPNAEKIALKTGVLPLRFRKQRIGGQVDVILAENALEFASIQGARTRRIGPLQVRIVRPEDLILHKIMSFRPRDREDLKSILIRQRGKLDLKYIRAWLKKVDKVTRGAHLYRLFNRLIKTC